MKKEINDLIRRYFELGLITVVLVPVRGPSSTQSLVYKEVRMRTAKAWGIKDIGTGEYSDELTKVLLDSEKEIVANELYEMTLAIIRAEDCEDDVVYGTETYLSVADDVKFNKKTGSATHLDKMMWSIVRLRKLKIISPFIRQYLQPIQDNNDNLMGNKVVPEEHLDNLDIEDKDDDVDVEK